VFLGFIKIEENQESMKLESTSKAPFTLGVRAEKTKGQLRAFLACRLAPSCQYMLEH
jgi:hypothetical protein